MVAGGMAPPEKVRRALRVADAIERAGGSVVDVSLRDDGNVVLEFGSGDVGSTGSGVIIKNGG